MGSTVWIVLQFIEDDVEVVFSGIYAVTATEAEADRLMKTAPKSHSLVSSYCYQKRESKISYPPLFPRKP